MRRLIAKQVIRKAQCLLAAATSHFRSSPRSSASRQSRLTAKRWEKLRFNVRLPPPFAPLVGNCEAAGLGS